MVNKNAERQRRFKERKAEQGLVMVKLWLQPEQAEALRSRVSANGTIEPGVSKPAVSTNNEGVSANDKVAALAVMLRDENRKLARDLEACKRRQSSVGCLSEKEWQILRYVVHRATAALATDAQRDIAAKLLDERKPLLLVRSKAAQKAD